MKHITKALKIIFCSIFVLLLCWVTLDFIIYNQAKKTCYDRQLDEYDMQPFKYKIKPYYDYNLEYYFKI